MSPLKATGSLAGQLLLAMPTLTDPNFSRSVVLICEHNAEGALGLIVNRPLHLNLGQVLDQLKLEHAGAGVATRPVFSGGPVETQRGFVLHDSPQGFVDSLQVGDALAVTSSETVLASIARNEGPRRFMVALGYAGWSPGQLERELGENAWLSAPSSPALVFDTAVEERWREAAARIGVDPSRLSAETGHA
jgi:putative transcriptional regulator